MLESVPTPFAEAAQILSDNIKLDPGFKEFYQWCKVRCRASEGRACLKEGERMTLTRRSLCPPLSFVGFGCSLPQANGVPVIIVSS